MKTKVLVIGVVMKGDKVLMRKKPEGSPPYHETWYIFGGELTPGNTVEEAIIGQVKKQTGIDIAFKQRLSWDSEVKKDLDDEEKMFIYLDTLCEYVSGELEILDPAIEKLEWVPKGLLSKFDIVPPSRKLFKYMDFI